MGKSRAASKANWNALRLKRIYEAPSPEDGQRVLVDRLWPRGLSKEKAELTVWLRDASPSDALRRKVHAAPEENWDSFLTEYRNELNSERAQAALAELERLLTQGPVTLLYAAKDEARNNAVALKLLLQR
ncbi:MAG: DUF488 family protein [Polyangiaceae bacterium]|nr:DUF488 family protein [Myxococcales bacterium]MCB9590739.1 DUF488 family protein [Polyangiaceae bacterium]